MVLLAVIGGESEGARPSPSAAPPAPSPLASHNCELLPSESADYTITRAPLGNHALSPPRTLSCSTRRIRSVDDIPSRLDSRERARVRRRTQSAHMSATPSSSASRDPSPRHRPHLGPRTTTTTTRLAASALTGTTSGSATPSTSYGSFPPANTAAERDETAAVKAVEDLLRDKLSPPTTSTSAPTAGAGGNRASSQPPRLRTETKSQRRRWTRSRERLLVRDAHGRVTDDVYDSDGDAGHTDEEEEEEEDQDQERGIVARDFYGYKGLRALTAAAAGENDVDPSEPWRSVNGKGRPPPSPPTDSLSPPPPPEARSRRTSRSRRGVDDGEHDKQWGVVKMELMARTWGRKGFLTVYAG